MTAHESANYIPSVATYAFAGGDMATTTNVVNLDGMIRRADLAAPGETGEDVPALSIPQLERTGFLYPALRKPDFQRETAHWSPDQVADLIATFARRDLIPAVILWRAGQNVFVIDGAHRLSALIAWVHDDYGDKEISRKFFQDIPDDQIEAAEQTRELVKVSAGSYRDHKLALEYPDKVEARIAAQATRIGWQNIPAQWIQTHDPQRAEKSFFRINQGGTKIDPTERRILVARQSATALAARAILRAGGGHSYWDKFSGSIQREIEQLGGAIYDLMFEPALSLPHKTLDVAVAGHGYGPHVLPLLFDLVNLVNDVNVPDSSNKRVTSDEVLKEDVDGTRTIRFLKKTRDMIQRICSNDPSSLGLHPALYFYTPTGVFQPAALLSFVALFNEFSTPDFIRFTRVRAKFEEFLLENRNITEAVRKLGSGSRSRPRLIALYKILMEKFEEGVTPAEAFKSLGNIPEFHFLFAAMLDESTGTLVQQLYKGKGLKGKKFDRDTKGAAYLRDALPTAPKCACGGFLHRNGMQTGHIKHRRDGGSGSLANAQLQHPFCNSTVNQ